MKSYHVTTIIYFHVLLSSSHSPSLAIWNTSFRVSISVWEGKMVNIHFNYLFTFCPKSTLQSARRWSRLVIVQHSHLRTTCALGHRDPIKLYLFNMIFLCNSMPLSSLWCVSSSHNCIYLYINSIKKKRGEWNLVLPFKSLSLNWVIGNIMASASWVERTAWQELSCGSEERPVTLLNLLNLLSEMCLITEESWENLARRKREVNTEWRKEGRKGGV